MAQRIKGQETQIIVVINGAPLLTMTTIRNFEVTLKTELLEEGYLGESTDRYDEVLKGLSFRGELHAENQDVLTVFWQSIHDRAVRRNPATKINIRTTLNFPNGDRPRVSLLDTFYGPLSLNAAERSQYIAFPLEGGCSETRIIPG